MINFRCLVQTAVNIFSFESYIFECGIDVTDGSMDILSSNFTRPKVDEIDCFMNDKLENNYETSYKIFKSAAVVCNNEVTCTVGKNILAEGGSVIDAAIASMLSLGVVSFQSAGIGGGFFMTYYDAETQNDYFIDAREVAPLAASEDMYDGNEFAKTFGRSSIAIPGEIRGFWEAHQKFGKLPWERLFAPAIDLAENGFKMTAGCQLWMNKTIHLVGENQRLRKLLKNPDGKFKQAGDRILRKNLAKTLRIIAKEGADAYYNGSLTQPILDDINDGFGYDSIITEDDLISYSVRITGATKINLDDNLTLITSGLPSGGPVLAFLMNILKGYNFKPDNQLENKTLAYHRIVEAMKFAYRRANQLGDDQFNSEVTHFVEEMLSNAHCKELRKKIDDFHTKPAEYYGYNFHQVPRNYGTAHIGIVGENGSAVAITGSINRPFGSNILGKRTGIIFNDHMENFTTPDKTTKHMRSNNLIKPGKRPLSSMSPTIILRNTAIGPEVKMVIGGAGGSRIIAASALTIIQSLWFNKNLDDAVRERRFVHYCSSNILEIEEGMDEKITEKLKERGHEIEIIGSHLSTVQVISRSSSTNLFAKCDCRKGGYPDGY